MVVAPWIRPGVVVHDPAETIDGLLAEFALDLRARGFAVAGYVQRNNRGCNGGGQGCAARIDYFDLAHSTSLSVARGAATDCLRRALREDADLVVISRFSACLEATENVPVAIGPDLDRGMPLLTSIAGQCLHKWHRFARNEGALIAPDLRALWRWWGPERLYRDLTLGVADGDVVQIACGPHWVLVQSRHGTGLAPLIRPPRGLASRLAGYARLGLRQLANLASSWDDAETALGIAAVNAHYNRMDLAGTAGNGVKAFRNLGGPVAVIGSFPGMAGILPGCVVLETAPRQGELPIAAIDEVVPECVAAVVTASTLANRTLPRILRLSGEKPAALVGPATPLTPRLFAYGLDILGGFVAHDSDGLAQAIRNGARAHDFGRFGRFLHLKRAP